MDAMWSRIKKLSVAHNNCAAMWCLRCGRIVVNWRDGKRDYGHECIRAGSDCVNAMATGTLDECRHAFGAN